MIDLIDDDVDDDDYYHDIKYEDLLTHIDKFDSDHPFDKLMLDLLPKIMKHDPEERITLEEIKDILETLNDSESFSSLLTSIGR